MAHLKDVQRKTSLNLVTGFFQYLRDEQEAVQKRTFTKWINSHLAKHKPPLEVNDLFEDIKDGVKLLALLEVLSGQRLPCEQGRQLKRIHWVSNIGTALSFLEGRKIKLVNIHATDIADGRPSIVLGLIWTVILYFQIEELTSNLAALQALSNSSSSVESVPGSDSGSPPMKRKVINKYPGNAKKALLRWVQTTAAKYHGIEVKDFGPSWRNGVAFESLVHAIRPDLVDMELVRRRGNRENLEEAFALAENELGIPRLLDPEDVDVDKPDEKSIMTYVAQFLKHYPNPQSETDGHQDQLLLGSIPTFALSVPVLQREERKMLRELKVFLNQLEKDVLRAQGAEGNLTDKYQAFKSFRVQYEMKKKQTEPLLQPVSRDGKLSVDQALVKQAWDRVSARLLEWHIHLDKSLPGPLGVIGSWLHRAEMALRDDIPILHAHEETANVIHRRLEQHTEILKSLEPHRQTFQQIHRDRSVNGVPVPPEQLQDMAERFNFVSTSCHSHLIKMEFWEMKYRLMSFIFLAESKLKTWIIKYGRRDSVELLLQNYLTFIENFRFFDQYDIIFSALKQSAEVYVRSDNSRYKTCNRVDEAEGVSKFLNETTAQWKHLALEVRSVRSMLEEVISNWDKYSSTVASLQAWLEDAELMLNQSEATKRDFFRNLSHWIQQHMDMNDSGNFLIETCDELVSRDLKQQLLLLNGRWRELFVKVKQYARADEVDKLRQDYHDGINTLKIFMDGTDEKMTAPVQVSFLNVRAFVQDVEEIKHKVPAMEAACKAACRTAQILTKDTPQEEVSRMNSLMASIKEQLSKVRERCLPLLKESQSLLPLLEEMEKNISGFYQALEKASHITGTADPEGPGDFKQRCQELATFTHSCKKCLTVIEKNHQSIQKIMNTSKTLQYMDMGLLQKRVVDLQSASQTMINESNEWRRHMEANSSLMKRFEESRIELEKVLKAAQSCITERGHCEELLRKHTEFFAQMDQRILNSFLKACDDLTDILPEQEQQSLQDTVRKLHKRWKDIQTDSPFHLLRLKVEAERAKLSACLQDCQTEVTRQNRHLANVGSERLIKEHRAFFRDKGPLSICEKRLQVMEDLCLKLPEDDSVHSIMETARKDFAEVREEIDSTYLKLLQHQDKWKDYNERYAELSCWLISKESQLRLLRTRANDPRKYSQVKASIMELRSDAELQESNLSWLKARMAVLLEVCADADGQRQASALSKLSTDFKSLLVSLIEADKMILAVGDCVQFREEVQTTLEDLVQGQKESQTEVTKILDSPNVRDAQQLLLVYQQLLKRLKLKRRDVQQLMTRGQQLQAEEGVGDSLQQDLQGLENTLSKMEHNVDSQDQSLEVTLAAWQEFESQEQAALEFVAKARSSMERDLSFSSPECLAVELDQAKVLLKQCEAEVLHMNTLAKRATEIQLGPKNKNLLTQQARSLREEVDAIESGLKKDVKTLEDMKHQWQKFIAGYEGFSLWISANEKQLELVKTSSRPLEEQMKTVKAVSAEVQDHSEVLSQLEAEAQALGQFVSSGEAARVRARLTQVRRNWEELKESVQQLEAQLEESSSQKQKFTVGLEEVQTSLGDFHTTLKDPIKSCTSSSDTYQTLQSHMDVCQNLERLRGPLLALTAGARRLSDRAEAEKTAVRVNSQFEQHLQEAKDKQNALEGLLSHWQRYEKQRSVFMSCLDRCEAPSKAESQYLSADKAKLHTELQELQSLQSELLSLEHSYLDLVSLGTLLCPFAPEEKVTQLKEEHNTLQKRLETQKAVIPQRIKDLHSHLSLVDQFDQALLKFSQWSDSMLSNLHSSSQVNINNLHAAASVVKETQAALEKQSAVRQSLEQQAGKLCQFCEPGDTEVLQTRAESCLQPYTEATQLADLQVECIDRLEAFLQTHSVAAGVLHGLRQTVENAGSWDRGRVEELQQELATIVPDINQLETLAVNLDSSLCKSHLHISAEKGTRKSCRMLADALSAELDTVRNMLGSKQNEAEALGALWTSFRQRKEQLLKRVEDIEEKADQQSFKEPTLHAVQQRLRFFNQLEDELQSHQHEEQWLRDKGNQLAQRDAELGGEVLREISLLETTWDDTKKLITERQEQCNVLVELMREYQALKTSISGIIEGAESVVDIYPVLKDYEESKKMLSKHETVKVDMASKQHELDQFSNKGKLIIVDLKRIPDCETQGMKKEAETIVDHWLDVSEKIDDNVEHLNQSLMVWEDVRRISEDIENWTNHCVSELNQSLSNLNDSHRFSARLSALQIEITEKEEKLATFQSKISELKKSIQSQETPARIQTLENDLQKKIAAVQKLFEQAKGNLIDFSSQRKQLEDYISQMSAWLTSMEEALVSSPTGSDPEDICRVKEIQKELQNQQGSIDATRESLNTLCRKYPSEELASLGSALTDLIKTYESVNQLSARTLMSLQSCLQHQFNDMAQEFHRWLSEQREIVKECSDRSGDTYIVDRKLQKIKGAMERVEEGEVRLTDVCEEGEKLLLHLPKASAGQVQQHLSSIQQDWDGFVDQCRQNQQILDDTAALMKGFEGRLKKLRLWLELMEKRMATDFIDTKQRSPEKVVLEQVEEYQQEVLKERDSFERLCQEAQALNEGGRGDGSETRVAAQLQSQHQALLRRGKDLLRSCQLTLQEQQAFEDTLQATWTWLSLVQERLASLNSTVGNKETLEKRLGLVQDILLMKGEGEVKLNMTVGKGEQVLKHNRMEGQEAICSQLQSLKDAWANMLMTSMSCHSRLEWTVTQWTSFLDNRSQLQQWMESVEQELGLTLPQQPGLKEKCSLLEQLRTLQADVDAHAAVLSRLTEKAVEMHEKTADSTFGPESRAELSAHFADISAVVKGKVQTMQNIVSEHEQYLDAVRDFNDWLISAKEELQRWSDLSGDSLSIKRKLSKVQELLDSKQRGRERLNRVQRCGAVARDHTGSGGYESMEREEAALLTSWDQWERGALQTRASLETTLSQMVSSEQEFSSLSAQLDHDLHHFSRLLHQRSLHLSQAEAKTDGDEAVKGWEMAKDTLDELVKTEPWSDSLKTQLNDLCRFSKDMGTQSDRVSTLIKEYNSLSLKASRECQTKEKLLDQGFRSSFREFQQWLVNTKINTAKCFDAPQNLSEASSSLQKIQEFLNDREQGQSKLNNVVMNGERVCSVAPKDKVEAVRVKMTTAREDWKSLLTNLHNRETNLQNLASHMKDFEASAEPLQDCLNATEMAVQESSTRLHDLTAKKLELHKLQSVLEDLASQEVQLCRLREKAQLLWDEHAAGKGFVYRVSQLSAQYLALTNLTKEKASRIERIVNEHQLFSQGLKELQNWVADTSHMLQTYCAPTVDKSVLDSRMIKLEALLTARQEKEIQIKMLITRGESVQRNTSSDGVPAVQKQLQELKDSWDALLSASIQCKSQLEGSLSQWTSYQEDVRQFVTWMERVEESLDPADKHCPEMRDKTANLRKTKLLYEEVLSHNALLETITAKSLSISENYVTQLELQDLQERYNSIKDNTMKAVGKAEELVKAHEEYQRGLQAFEEWLEQEQEKLGCYMQLEGDVDMLEDTLQKLQELQLHCTEGQALLNTLSISREQVVSWGLPQIEDRALETLQQEWRLYQARLAETRSQLNSALAKLRQMEQKFQCLDSWLKGMETKAQLRLHRRSDRTTKDAQLQLIKSWQEEVLVYQEEMEGLSILAQQVLDETHISSRISSRATQITARYHALLLHLLETIKQLQEEVSCIEEAQNIVTTFSDWLSTAQNNFSTVAISVDVVDRFAMDRKMKKLESFQTDIEQGHTLLKTMREKTERAMTFLEEPEAEQLKEEVDAHLSQLEFLVSALRAEHSSLEKCLSLSKDFMDKYKTQAQWVLETKNLLAANVEPKAELYQKKAQLAKYKTIQQTVQSHEPAVKSVLEKGENLLELVHDPIIRENMKKLQTNFQDLSLASKIHVQNLVDWVKEHEDYNSELQEVEKWLLQMSSRLVTSDSMQTSSMEMATQQLARHKAIMDEISSFEDRLNSLKQKGEDLVASCSGQVQAKVSQQIQAHQHGTRDSYSAICSTAQRVYHSLDRELQKHVSHQDTLEQCQTWLCTVQKELNDQGPSGLQEALKQVKHYRALQEQASTYLDLVCSVCDLSDDVVRVTAAEVQQVKLTIEERMSSAQELSEGWRQVRDQKQDLTALFQDMEQQLLCLSRRPAELEIKIAQNMLSQAKDCSQLLQSKKSTLTGMSETVSRLTGGQGSQEISDLDRLSDMWLELCHQANRLQIQREDDLQRAQEYHTCISAVEALFEQVSREWDNLARTDAESSSQHLDALRQLAIILEEQKGALEDLKEQKQKVIQHLNLDDKELVKEQISHFEQRWMQMQNLIEKKVQDSMVTLEDMSQVEARLREARDWAEEQQPALSEAMKMSPPPELAQSFLFDHLSICSELEAKQLLLDQAMTDADRVLARLGLSERQNLQQLISDTQNVVESLSVKMVQRRKHLSKAFTERTQFLMAVNQSISWVQQNEKKAQAEECIALLPEDLAKQVRTCRNIQSSLKAYQSELTSLWSQGRDLMRNASEEEKNEILSKLQELQNTFDRTLHRCGQKLQELEKVLVSRKYFKTDLEKICQWLKQADIVTFPEINLMVGDAELDAQLFKYEQIIEQAIEYENLLLIVQRAGQEILPTLNEVDHCFLDEKLNTLPQQYNSILTLAKEKHEKIQQAIFTRNEYASFIDVTHKALKELEEQYNHLGTQPVGLQTEEVVNLQSDYKAIQADLSSLGLAVSELNQKKEGFRSTGQPWRSEEMTLLVSLYNSLKRLVEQKVEHLDETLESFEDHKAMALQVDSELRATKEQLVRVNSETQSAEERLQNYHALAGSLHNADSHLSRLMEQMDTLAPRVDQATQDASKEQIVSWQEELRSLQSAVGELIEECENRFVQSKDFETEMTRTLDWLQKVRDDLSSAVIVDMRVEKVQEEIRKQQIMQEEVQSRLRIVAALSSREKQKYISANELVPFHLDTSLEEMAKLQADVQKAMSSKLISLEEALGLCQKYHFRMQSACEWLEDAVSFLQQASLGVDVENYEECLRQQEDIMATEQEFLIHLDELQDVFPQLQALVNPTAKEQLGVSVDSAKQRGAEVRDQLQCHQDVLQSCVSQWKSYQESRQTVIELMNDAEKKLTEFCTAKAATSQEAEDKLCSHRSLVSLVNGFQEKLSELEEQASQLELVGSDASKATISRSMTTVWQRWTRLRSVARGQERILEDTAHEWWTFREKMAKVKAVTDELQSRVPDSSVEKASKATLQSLLDQNDLLSQDLERELSSLMLLRQYALSLLHDMEVPSPTSEQDELPSLREIRAVQEQMESLLTQSRTKRAQAAQELRDREEVEKELSVVKTWIQETRELLLNPTLDIDALLQELEIVHGDVISYRQSVDKLAEQQQSKYLDLYTILPSEISMQLAEVSLALGAIEDQVLSKEREIQKTREIKEHFSSRIHDISVKLKAASTKFKEKSPDVDHAKEEVKSLVEDLDVSGRALAELEAGIQDFSRRNPFLAKQLSDAISKLSEMHHHTSRLADCRNNWLKKAVCYLDEYNEMLDFIVRWSERARGLARANIIWTSSVHLQEQIRMYQSVLRESRELHGDLESMSEKVDLLSEVLQVESMVQQVCSLSRLSEELQQNINTRLQSLEDAHKSMEALEYEVKALHVALEQVQATLTSPELSRQSLKEQLAQRQRLLADMEGFKQQVQAVQLCQSALRVPEEVMPNLAICRTALRLQQEASQLQHVAIQQCNILQEAVVQYEQYEQEMRDLQRLIEEAHRTIQDRPIPSSNIQELQAQILHHEELAQRIKGYQEQIASLNSKCKMLAVKAKHATMLLSVTDVEELPEELDGDKKKLSVQTVTMTAGRCHTLLSPVTEESGEEATSEISSSSLCRSPSPLTESEPTVSKMGRGALIKAPVQELYDPTFDSVAHLDDLQRSWESLKNVISEKQRSLYEALEKQQHYQTSLQSVSSKMETLENKLSEPLETDISPDSHRRDHQDIIREIQTVQDEIDKLQLNFSEDLVSNSVDSEMADQLAMQSSLSVLAERMTTIHMKVSGKQQQLEECVSDRLEGQRQEQALQQCLSEAEVLELWLNTTLQELSPSDENETVLCDCQNMLLEIEEKVQALSELSMHSDNLLLEGRAETKEEAERLTRKLSTVKSGLLELQKMLQLKHNSTQGSLQEQEDSSSDSSLSQSPSVQDWMAQARTTRSQQHQYTLQRQRELEEQLAEQKKLLQSVASRGEEILIRQSSPSNTLMSEPFAPENLAQKEAEVSREQMRQRWESLKLELKTKLQLLQKSLEQDQKQPLYGHSRVTASGPLFKGQSQADKSSLKSLYDSFRQTIEDIAAGPGDGKAQLAQMEQQLFTAVASTSSWLDGVENNVFSGSVLMSENAETQLQKQEILESDVMHVTEDVKLSRSLLGGSCSLRQEDRHLLEDNLDCLKERLGTLGSALGQRCGHMRTRAQELTAFQSQLQLFQTVFIETKCQILQALAEAIDKPVPKQLEVIANAEENLRALEQRITELKARGVSLQTDQLSTNKLIKLQDSYEELVMTVGCRRSGLNQNMALKEQFDRALQDLADLVDTAKDKMAADHRIIASSLEEVQNHLYKHKEFFQGLETHMILTETYFRKISSLIPPKESGALEETLSQAQDVLKKAHSKGVELERIHETWGRLALDYHLLNQHLEAVEGSMPRVGLVEETEEKLLERISLYQGLKGRLTEHQHRLHQVLDEGKHLLQLVCCVGLENQLALLGEHWINNTTKVNKELQRLEATLRHWSRYQQECAELSQWLQSALERLEFWNTQAVLVPQELETVRDHLTAFLEFSKEVESKSSLKSSVVSEGNQLLRLKKVDTVVLRSDLGRVDQQWTELLTRIPVVQEKLHQIQMEKLASRHAISELFNWISLMENVIAEDEENLKSAVGSTVIQDYLQKYKGFRVDLTCKQLTVDFVNQSVLQLSGQEAEVKRSDKTDFAERLGAMNRRWQILQAGINERIQFLESLLVMWLEYESSVQALKSWMSTQEERLKRKQRIEDITSVQNALRDCQEMDDVLKEKEKELERVEEQGCALVQNKTDEACAIVMETLQGVNHTWANLDHLSGQLKISLKSVLDQWTLYKKASEEINGFLIEGRYSVSRFRLLTGSLEAVQSQVQNLQDLQEELEKQEGSLRKFGAITHQLLKECHPSVSDSLHSALKDINARWTGLLEEIAERLKSSKALLQLWQRYKELYDQSCCSVQLQEEKTERLLKTSRRKDMADEAVSDWIHQCTEVLRSQAPGQASLQVLHELGEQLKQQVDISAASAIQSDHLSLCQRLSALEHALTRQLSSLQTGVHDYETFNDQLDSLGNWITEAEDVLKIQDPNGSTDLTAIQERMEELKKLMLKFSCIAPELERLNELGYRLPLNDSEIKRMQNLNRSWSTASAQTTERFSKLQSFLLQQQTFLEKCETWMEFLVQTEDNLAVEISGNFLSLMEQQKAHELFQAEMFSRQQILHSIISDGQRMLEQGQVDDRDEFNLKLALLSNQWQGVVRRAQQRRGIIDGLIRQWQRYREMVEKLRKWLVEVSHPTEALQSGATIPLQQARCMLDAVQLKEKVLQRQQGSYILTVEAARQLLLSADGPAEAALQAELTEIQETWKQSSLSLEAQRKELATLLKDWERCEKGICSSLEKLRAFKRQLSQPLPDHHEDLQSEQLRCKDLENTFDGWTGDLAHLAVLRESLSCFISPEDLCVLQERVELLHRQWDEMCHQLSLRRQQLCEKLNEWSVFNEKYKELCEWLTNMESKVSQNGDISIEEMIDKLRKDYQEEITLVEQNKSNLHELGERLSRASHQSKASEIQQKMGKVSERWQHLLDLIGARGKKLKETLVAVQQLDKNMSSLRFWLVHIETELSKPIAYDSCDYQEIQTKLEQQQVI
uniref:Calponin-homology (CH) domain-containing protein n=1 Tax=Knipowitschia caucasica TaxID=637954 RepID=A0AAV2JAL2_KNICA